MKRLALFVLLSLPCLAATGDITAVRIISTTSDTNSACNNVAAICNGWVAEIDITGLATGGTYNFFYGTNNRPTASTPVMAITGPGYTGRTLGSRIRTIYLTHNIRQPYPNQAVDDETTGAGFVTVRVALSDFVYSGDTSGTIVIPAGMYTKGGVPNNAYTGSVTIQSTLAYSGTKSVWRWATVPYQRETADFSIELATFNRFGGLDGRMQPVAGVDFTCTDAHSNTWGPTLVTNITRSSQPDQFPVLIYQTTVPVSGLTQGDTITCNAKVYPIFGDATAVVDSTVGQDGTAQPSQLAGPLLEFNDKTGAYGGAAAVVDATNGHASALNTWVAASQTTAEANYVSSTANSYTAIGYAVQALKSYNNAHNGHNDPGCSIILVTGLTNDAALPSVGSFQGAQTCWVTVTHLSTSTRAAAGFSSGSIANTLNTQLIRWYDLTLTGTTGTWFNGQGTSPQIWFDHDALNLTQSSAASGFSLGFSTNNSITAYTQGFSSPNGTRFGLVRGNSAPGGTTVISGDGFAFLGNSNLLPIFESSGTTTDNFIVAFNRARFNVQGYWFDDAATANVVKGGALVQNDVETIGASDAMGLTELCAGQNTGSTTCNNIMLLYNVSTGERSNLAYNWLVSGTLGPFVDTNWSVRGNVFDGWNCKTDTDSANASSTPTGNWAVEYSVGMFANQKRFEVGLLHLGGEFIGINSFYGGSFAFVNCASFNYSTNGCSNAGGGDYRLKSSAGTVNVSFPGGQMLPYDLAGQKRDNGPWGSAGPYAQEMIRTKAFGW